MMPLQTSTKAIQVVLVVTLAFAICQSPSVTAESFGNCVVDSVTGDNVCIWSDSPVTFSDVHTGDVIILGEYSYLYAVCDAGSVSFSVSNCECRLVVQDYYSSIETSDFCNSCSFNSLTASGFSIHYDCSNQVTGNCVAINSNGCQSNQVNPTPFPAESPTGNPTSPPIDDPTPFPVESPTDFPVESPTDFPAESPTDFPVESPMDFPVESPVDEPTSSQEEGDNDDDDEEEEEGEETESDNNEAPIPSPSIRSPAAGGPVASTSESVRSVQSGSGNGGMNPTNMIGSSITMFVIILLSLLFS